MLEPRSAPEGKKGGPESPATAAIKCAYHLMQQRIISNPKDMMGVLFFGTEASKFYDEDESSQGDLSYPHCYLFTDLDVPAADDVKKLRALAEVDEETSKVLVPSKDRVSMANVLFCANQIFTSKAANFLSRRLFIITDNDNPHGDDRTLRSAATVRAKDLYDLGVIIELFPISRPDHEFDRTKFYDVGFSLLCTICAYIVRISFTKPSLPIPKHLLLTLPVRKARPLEVTGLLYLILSCLLSTLNRFRVERCSPIYLWRLALTSRFQ
jgi:hypothetical protein